jgi:hypothetical protein
VQAEGVEQEPIARAGHLIAAIGYAAVAWTGVHLLLRLRVQSSVTSRKGLEWLLSQTWGGSVLTLAGAIVLLGSAGELRQAWSGRLRERFRARRMGRRASRLALSIARFGLAARGLVFGIVGWFLIRTAREKDPSQFREIGGALAVLSRTPAGPWLMGIAGLGLVAFAFYMWTLAVFRRT